MNKIKIFSDSTCDMSPELIDKYDISIVPLSILLGDKSYSDGTDITPDEIYKWSDEHNTTPKTAAIPLEKTREIMKPFMDDGFDIIFFCISSQMSSTCNVPRIVATQEDYDRVFVIDSENLSTGIGLQIIRAAELVKEGFSAEEIVQKINADKNKVRASFIIDTLTFLARGGRCTAVTALMANTLKFHPLISVKEGKMSAGKKYRGKMSMVLSMYVDDLIPALEQSDRKRVFITHSGCEDAVVNNVREKIEALGIFEEILVTRAGGVISSHCGPNTLGVLFYTK